MKTKLEAFEDRLLEKLTNPNPTPKYKLWQTVRYSLADPRNNPKQIEAKIIGFYFTSVGVAFHQQGSDPGWYYYRQDENSLAIGVPRGLTALL